MTTFRIVKTYTGKYALLSKGGTSVTGKRFRCPADAKAWAAKAEIGRSCRERVYC